MRPDDVVITSQADLQQLWRTLMEPLGFGSQCLWLMLVGDDGRPLPRLVQIDETDQPPTPDLLEGLAGFMGEIRADLMPDARCAFLRTRPGGAGLTPDDRAWAAALYAAGRLADVPLEVVHLACDVDLVPVPMDDVLAEPA